MMVLVLMMLVLVLAQADDHETSSRKTLLPILIPSAAPAQADDHDHENSSRKTLVPIIPRPAATLSQDYTPSSTGDCDTTCSAECSLAKRFPKHYAACIDHCKRLHCKYTPSYAILKCTIICVDSISPKLASGML